MDSTRYSTFYDEIIMPLYDFLNNETGEIEEHNMYYTKLDQFKLDNPHLLQKILGTPSIVGGHGDRVKVDGGFKEVLHKVASGHKLSPMADKIAGVQDAKDIKTREIVNKHVDLQTKNRLSKNNK